MEQNHESASFVANAQVLGRNLQVDFSLANLVSHDVDFLFNLI
jgi:hypothetical protein